MINSLNNSNEQQRLSPENPEGASGERRRNFDEAGLFGPTEASTQEGRHSSARSESNKRLKTVESMRSSTTLEGSSRVRGLDSPNRGLSSLVRGEQEPLLGGFPTEMGGSRVRPFSIQQSPQGDNMQHWHNSASLNDTASTAASSGFHLSGGSVNQDLFWNTGTSPNIASQLLLINQLQGQPNGVQSLQQQQLLLQQQLHLQQHQLQLQQQQPHMPFIMGTGAVNPAASLLYAQNLQSLQAPQQQQSSLFNMISSRNPGLGYAMMLGGGGAGGGNAPEARSMQAPSFNNNLTAFPNYMGNASSPQGLASWSHTPFQGLLASNAAGRSISSGGPKTLPAILAQTEDALKLSSHQVLLRQQIEAFQATEDDIAIHIRGRNKPISLGQVGIRCRHCAHLPIAQRQKGSTYFPATMIGIYQAAQNMSTSHLQCGLCTEMPEEIKVRFVHALASKAASSGAGRPYWAHSAKKLGLVDTEEHGIRFIHNLPEGVQPVP